MTRVHNAKESVSREVFLSTTVNLRNKNNDFGSHKSKPGHDAGKGCRCENDLHL